MIPDLRIKWPVIRLTILSILLVTLFLVGQVPNKAAVCCSNCESALIVCYAHCPGSSPSCHMGCQDQFEECEQTCIPEPCY